MKDEKCKGCLLENEDCCNYEPCYTSDPFPEISGVKPDPEED